VQGDIATRLRSGLRGVRALARQLEVALGRIVKWGGRLTAGTGGNGRHGLEGYSSKEGEENAG
jgi:hypothetical protein